MAEAREYAFLIDAYTPETMPMGRLGEYMHQLALMQGERQAVHFASLEPGSTKLVYKVETEADPKVRARVQAVKHGAGPPDAMRAYRAINRMLRDDNAIGVVEEAAGAEIMRFPGRDDAHRITTVSQKGTLDGEVLRVGGPGDWVPIMLRTERVVTSGCWAKKSVAKALGMHLFEPVRLFGNGRWIRDDDGAWTLDRFTVATFDALNDAPLSSVLTALRALGGEWGEGALEELRAIRQDPLEQHNGGV